jgi:hypothetical protein
VILETDAEEGKENDTPLQMWRQIGEMMMKRKKEKVYDWQWI